jgi:hypothetical protein
LRYEDLDILEKNQLDCPPLPPTLVKESDAATGTVLNEQIQMNGESKIKINIV